MAKATPAKKKPVTSAAVKAGPYVPDAKRYERLPYRRCDGTGLHLPAISLGCWHNFGAPGTDAKAIADEKEFHANCRRMLFTAFDHGITHFDLANNYGPPPGAAEERVGRILKELPREELVISSKAGYRMWPGPYGEWGSRKYLLQSLDQSLKRLGLDHVDIFYHHRPDPNTPLEETMGALDQAVRSGKALYVGVSNYGGALLSKAVRVCRENGFAVPMIDQPNYHMFNRGVESDLLPVARANGVGVIAFCPLAQGLLTNKYLAGIPKDSRAGSGKGFLKAENVKPEQVAKVQKLNAIAQARGQTMAQLALSWVLRHDAMTSALIGASRPEQIVENVKAAQQTRFTADELAAIEAILAG
jgi:L-glyceraldehyde 3-phosphate reductase